jgi:hypothetical protein
MVRIVESAIIVRWLERREELALPLSTKHIHDVKKPSDGRIKQIALAW